MDRKRHIAIVTFAVIVIGLLVNYSYQVGMRSGDLRRQIAQGKAQLEASQLDAARTKGSLSFNADQLSSAKADLLSEGRQADRCISALQLDINVLHHAVMYVSGRSASQPDVVRPDLGDCRDLVKASVRQRLQFGLYDARIATKEAAQQRQPPVPSTSPSGGATARCADGTLSYSQNRSGTCSWHGGVAVWL